MAYKYQTFADLLYGSNSRLRFRIVTLNEKRAVYVMSVVSDLNSLRFQNGTTRLNNLEAEIDEKFFNHYGLTPEERGIVKGNGT